jgi:hypothetical protein
VVAVDVWPEAREQVQTFVDQMEISYRVLLGGGQAGQSYGIHGIPALFLIDPQGRLAGSQVGLRPGMEASLEEQVKAILPGKS